MMTVVFSTHDRCRILPRVLDRYRALAPVPGGWKLVVIANACSDGSGTVLASYAGLLPLTVLEEPQKGKNRALNRALPLIEGDVAVFTDDDVLVEPDWLAELRRGVDAHPEATIFGGTVRPAWERPPPGWLVPYGVDLGMVYALTERPDGPCDAGDVWGPNMAIRAAVFRDGHRFNAAIGPDGTAVYAMGSEVDLNRRLQSAGHKACFIRRAVVNHMIRADQLDEAWIVQRAYRHGLGMPLWDGELPFGTGPRLAGVPVRMWLRRALLEALAPVVRPLPRFRKRFRILYFRNWFRGAMRTLREQHRRSAGGLAQRPSPLDVRGQTP